jgi:hypothetical protein
VLRRGGHSTYRIIPKYATAAQPFLTLWRELEDAGCTYEEAESMRLLTIDVPPEADIDHVYALLEQGVVAEVWDFQEGHCGHAVRRSPRKD